MFLHQSHYLFNRLIFISIQPQLVMRVKHDTSSIRNHPAPPSFCPIDPNIKLVDMWTIHVLTYGMLQISKIVGCLLKNSQ
jgi:hypothetical protein